MSIPSENMGNKLSVVICAYNPDKEIFARVINSLKGQTLIQKYWELLIIDNNCDSPIEKWLDISWHQEARIIRESMPGLIHARNRATIEARYEYLISVDDDTVLCNSYLASALEIYCTNPQLGIIGGKSIAKYIETPPKWISQFDTLLAIRDLGDNTIIQHFNADSNTGYPTAAPILIAPRKACMIEYLSFFESNQISKTLGRKGTELTSGEDNDINMFIYLRGYKIGYFPELIFEHIIPPFRTTKKYLSKMAYASNRSWVKMLANHQINPWQKISPNTVLLRQIKAFFKFKAWLNTPNYINWKGACGLFKGLSEL